MRLKMCLALLAALMLSAPVPAEAQAREGLMGDLIRDVAEVEKKVIGLAKAMPQSAYDWRPAKGVRSPAETFMHVAADNYFLPLLMGNDAPAETGITKDYKTTVTFEKKTTNREAIITELEKSFAFLKSSMTAMPDARLDAALDLFGQKSTNRGLWITATTHLHEHLGQLIAYARTNNVTPPWSK
jgi:DinB superfamily